MRLVVLGQSGDVFRSGGLENVESWEPVSSAARRRRCFFDGKDTLACFIASRSDIDDVIPILTAYQIEWNKFHTLLQHLPSSIRLADIDTDVSLEEVLTDVLHISWEDVQRLHAIWGDDFVPNLEDMAANQRRLRVKLLSGSLSEYPARYQYVVGQHCPTQSSAQEPAGLFSFQQHPQPGEPRVRLCFTT